MSEASDFESDLIEIFGERIKQDSIFCKDIYSALTNLEWVQSDGTVYGATFRYVGGLIADIREEGNYMDWYCCKGEGFASDEIQEAMSMKGWTCREYDK